MYIARATNRFLTVTGDTLFGCETMPDFTAGLETIINKYMMRPSQPTAQERRKGTKATLALTDAEICTQGQESRQWA